MLLFAKPMPPKVPKRRTRTGCASCKDARKKCCERRPQCTRCEERGLDCVYLPVNRRRSRADGITSQPRQKAPVLSREPKTGAEYAWGQLPEEPCVESSEVALSTSSVSSCDTPDWGSSSCQFDLSEEQMDSRLFEQFGSMDEPGSCSDFTQELITTSATSQPGLTSMLELPYPSFFNLSDDTQDRKLIHHFCTVLSHLIVFTEEPDNSFQELILPLASENSPVLHAMCAFSKGHLEYMGVQDSKHSSNFRVLAAEGVFSLVQQNCRYEEVLAATMLLVYYESLTLTGSSNMVLEHLRSAFVVLSSMPKSAKSQSVKFLEKAFQFYDVIAALSLAASPVSATPDSDHEYPLGLPSPKLTRTTFGDPLLGMTGDLWPILYRLSSLKALKGDLESAVTADQQSKVSVLRTEYEATSRAIENALQEWVPPILPKNITTPFETQAGAQDSLQAMVHNSLAYRHSALVYLNRSIYGYPVNHPAVQTNCYLALKSCVAVISSGGPVNALLWPLFVAACEAITDHDRGLARYAFMEIERRQGMINIERARAIVLHQWASVSMDNVNDTCSGRVDTWREIAGGMGFTIIFG
ncbi:hypothetical protein CGMCC3_g16583 [Colletotrichum fructicola]|nr:uncharacterized protein CGMCC3_g16583 [Colletotrichum fructicola]KAE9567272.1 hypothetical protein CGMCC3_g16583 [Colletotrichum fructicola]